MKAHRQQGFTIIELMIAIIVSAILSISIMSFVAYEIDQSTILSIKASLYDQAEAGLNKINTDIRLSSNADAVNRWLDNYAPISGNQYSWQSNSSTLVLATAAQDANGNILWQDYNDYIPYKNNIIYFLQNGTLYKRILAAPISGNAALTTCPASNASATCPADSVILNNVTNFSVSYLDGYNQPTTPTSARSVALQIGLSITKFNQTFSNTYSTQMVFRND